MNREEYIPPPRFSEVFEEFKRNGGKPRFDRVGIKGTSKETNVRTYGSSFLACEDTNEFCFRSV